MLDEVAADVDPLTLARICQRAENGYVGVQSGLMDQFAEACGVAGSAVLLDCRSLEWRPVPLPDDVRIVVLHTGSKRHLDGSEYNLRRSQCEAAVAAIAKDDPAVTSLRDVTRFHLSAARSRMDAVAYRRAEHVVTENQRVAETVAALESGDLAEVGVAFAASHASLRERFEVVSPELDAMVEIAIGGPGGRGRADDRRRLRGMHGQPRPARGRRGAADRRGARLPGPDRAATDGPAGPGGGRRQPAALIATRHIHARWAVLKRGARR